MNALQAVRKAPRVPGFDVERIRADFPILKLQVNGKPLVYLDNTASSQMPQQVIDRLVRYQTTQHANINRAVHSLSEIATNEYEQARRKLQHFIHAREEREVIFTSCTTDAINLVPTIPQLYIKGEFVGGSDIMREMFEQGELQKLLQAAEG